MQGKVQNREAMRDYPFRSPSAAATVTLGAPRTGSLRTAIGIDRSIDRDSRLCLRLSLRPFARQLQLIIALSSKLRSKRVARGRGADRWGPSRSPWAPRNAVSIPWSLPIPLPSRLFSSLRGNYTFLPPRRAQARTPERIRSLVVVGRVRYGRVRDYQQPPWQQTLPKGRRSSRLGLPGRLRGVIAADCNPGKPHPASALSPRRKIRRSA